MRASDAIDYVIVGAGPAGCVLANRLSADPAVEVLLVEAGDRDTNPLIAMPRGFGELLGDPAIAWHYPVRPFGPAGTVEHWVRGKTLGGSSAVNGMVYNRGGRTDYDDLARLGNPGWGWDDMLPAFRAIEDNALGASAVRGAGGPLHVSTVEVADPLLEDVLTAGTELGWRRVRDLNESDEERIGYTMATIRDGRRCSAADAFLRPVLDRPNLAVALRTVVDRVVLDGGRAVGVRGRRDGRAVEIRAAREVILAAGSIATPKILQFSVRSDQEIIDAGLTTGTAGYHAVGTCAMGPRDEDVVDPRLRVRGVPHLRVVDASVLPIMVAGNLNGPVCALAWRAADLITAGSAGTADE